MAMRSSVSEIRWHDLRRDWCEYPDEEEEVMVTIDADGFRRVWTGCWYRKLTDGNYAWVYLVKDENDKVTTEMIWYPVIAWARYPDPYNI